MSDELEDFIGNLKSEIQHFQPKSGDLFVLTIPGCLTIEESNRIKTEWNKHTHPCECVVVTGGVKVSVHRMEAPAKVAGILVHIDTIMAELLELRDQVAVFLTETKH